MKNLFDKLFNPEDADLPTDEVADLPANEVVDLLTCAILKLPRDILKSIMVRVAATPTNGGFAVYNSSFTSKEFLKLSQEERVLKSAVFGDLPRSYFPDSLEPNPVISWGSGDLDQLMLQFQVINQMGGYIFKAAKAGNLSARLVLAKLIIRSFSEVYEGTNEALRSESVDIEKARKRDRASAFISYFEDQSNASSAVDLLHTNLVKTFLKEASSEELQQMKPYIDDYVLKCVINKTSIVNRHYLMFHIKLEALTDSRDTYILRESARTFSMAFHNLCYVASSTMQRLGVNSMIPHNLRLASMKVVKDNYCSYTTLIDCFNSVNDLLVEGYTEAYNLGHIIIHDNNPRVVTITTMVDKFLAVQQCLSKHLRLVMHMSKIRDDLISEFHILLSS